VLSWIVTQAVRLGNMKAHAAAARESGFCQIYREAALAGAWSHREVSKDLDEETRKVGTQEK